MLVVSPRGVHCRFWSHVGRLGRRVTILTHSGISQGFTYERIYKNLECSLDITGSDCCKRYFPGIGFNNRKKKNIHVLKSCQKIFLRRINRNGSENKLSINKQKKALIRVRARVYSFWVCCSKSPVRRRDSGSVAHL